MPSQTKQAPWYIYILLCNDDSLYTGVTTSLARRIDEHNQNPRGARYTRARRPVRLIYFETSTSRSEAQKREYEIRKLSQNEKIYLAISAYERLSETAECKLICEDSIRKLNTA